MEENENLNDALTSDARERTFTQSQVEAIISQYKIKLDSLQNELQRRDLGNFYQTLSVLFEVIRNRDAYTSDFIKKCVETVEDSVAQIFNTEDKDGQ
jgi:hypothetical protein